MKILRPFLVVCTGLLAAVRLLAQPADPARATEAPPAGKASPTVSVTFTAVAFGNGGPAAGYLSGGTFTTLRLPAGGARSTEYKYTGPANLVFTSSAPSADPATAKPPVVARATLPAGAARLLLVFVSDTDGWSVGVLDDNANALPFGSARVFNASPATVSINYNFTHTAQLKPRQSLVFPPEKGLVAVEVSIQQPDGTWTKQVNNGWELGADARRDIFILNGAAFRNSGVAERAIQMFSREEKKPAARGN